MSQTTIDNQRTTVVWSNYLATAYAEGFCEGEDATFEEKIEAWAYLIKTKLCYSLQGWFGRQANDFIEAGYVDKNGNIDWDLIDEARDYE